MAQEVWSASAESFSVEWCGAADDEHLGDAHVLAGIAMSVKSPVRRDAAGWGGSASDRRSQGRR